MFGYGSRGVLILFQESDSGRIRILLACRREMVVMPELSPDPLSWTRRHSPILASLAERFRSTEPLDGYDIAVSSSVTTNTGVLIETLREAGADSVVFTSAGPKYNEPAVIEALEGHSDVRAFVEPGMTNEDLAAAHGRLLETKPDFIIEDGCVLTAKLHADYPEIAKEVIGAVEQTTIGITRLRAMDRQGVLEYPVYGVNDTPMKHYFDNVHGTGETTLTGVMTTTNLLFSGATVVVIGYGYCGRGVARKASGMGADTIVTEIDPRKALEAKMDGHRVMPMSEAAAVGEYFIAATGNVDAIRRDHIESMADDAILASAGMAAEIDVAALEDLAESTAAPMPGITEYRLSDGRSVHLLADGHVVNLAGPHVTGHPAEVMDMTFAMMFMGAYDMIANDPDLEPGLHGIPDRLDREVADQALATMDVEIDELTERQRAYMEDWEHADTRM